MVELSKDLLFQFDVIYLFQVYDVRLGNLLQGENLFGGSDDLLHSAESASAECFRYFVF